MSEVISSVTTGINALQHDVGVDQAQLTQQTEIPQNVSQLANDGTMIIQDMQPYDVASETQSPVETVQNEVVSQVMKQTKSNFELVAGTAYGAISSSNKEDGVAKILELESSLFKRGVKATSAKAYLATFNKELLFDDVAVSKTYQSAQANELNQYLQAYATVAKNSHSSITNNVAVYKSMAFIGSCAMHFPATKNPDDNPATCLASDLVNLTSAISTDDVNTSKQKIAEHLQQLAQLANTPEQKELVEVLQNYFDKLGKDKSKVVAIADGSEPQFTLDTHHETEKVENNQEPVIKNHLGDNSGLPSTGLPENMLENNRSDHQNLQAIQSKSKAGEIDLAIKLSEKLKNQSAYEIAMNLITHGLGGQLADLIKVTASNIDGRSEQFIAGSKFLDQLLVLLDLSKQADDANSSVTKEQVFNQLKSMLGLDSSTTELTESVLVDQFKKLLGLDSLHEKPNDQAAAKGAEKPNDQDQQPKISRYELNLIVAFKFLIGPLLSPATQSQDSTHVSNGNSQVGTDGSTVNSYTNSNVDKQIESLSPRILYLLASLLNISDEISVQQESSRQKAISLPSEFKLMNLLSSTSLLLGNDKLETADVLKSLNNIKSLPWHEKIKENAKAKAQAAETQQQVAKLLQSVQTHLNAKLENEQAAANARQADPNAAEIKTLEDAALKEAQAAKEAALQAVNLIKDDLHRTFGIAESETKLRQYDLDHKPYDVNDLNQANKLLNALLADNVERHDLERIFTTIIDGISDNAPAELCEQLQDKLRVLREADDEDKARTAFNDLRRTLSLYTAQGAEKFKELANIICPKHPKSSDQSDVDKAASESITEFSKQLLNSDGRDLAQSLNALVHASGSAGSAGAADKSMIDIQNLAVVNALTQELNQPHRYSYLPGNEEACNVFRNLEQMSNSLSAISYNSFFKQASTDNSPFFDTSVLTEQIDSLHDPKAKEQLQTVKTQIEAAKNAMAQFKRTGQTIDFLSFMQAIHNLEPESFESNFNLIKAKAVKALETANGAGNSGQQLDQDALSSLEKALSTLNGDLSKLKANENLLLKLAYHNFCAEHGYSEDLSSSYNKQVHEAFLQEIDKLSLGQENSFVDTLKQNFNDRNLNLSGINKVANLLALNMNTLNIALDPIAEHIDKASSLLGSVTYGNLNPDDGIGRLAALKAKFAENLQQNSDFQNGLAMLSNLHEQGIGLAVTVDATRQALDLEPEEISKYNPKYKNPKLHGAYETNFSTEGQEGEVDGMALLGAVSMLVQSPDELPDSFLKNIAKVPAKNGENLTEQASYERPLTYEQLQVGFANLANRPGCTFEARLFLERGYELWSQSQTPPQMPSNYSSLTPEKSKEFLDKFTMIPDSSVAEGAAKLLISESNFVNTTAKNRSARFTHFPYDEQLELLKQIKNSLVGTKKIEIKHEGNSDKEIKNTGKLVEQKFQALQDVLTKLANFKLDKDNDINKYHELQKAKDDIQRELLSILFGKDCKRLEVARYSVLTAHVTHSFFSKQDKTRADHMQNISGSILGKEVNPKGPIEKKVLVNADDAYSSYGVDAQGKSVVSNSPRMITVHEFPEPETSQEKFMAVLRDNFMGSAVAFHGGRVIDKADETVVKDLLLKGKGTGGKLARAVCGAIEETLAELKINTYDELGKALNESSKNQTVQEALTRNLAGCFDPSIKSLTKSNDPNTAEADLNKSAYKAAQAILQYVDVPNHLKRLKLASSALNLSSQISMHCTNLAENINALFDQNQNLSDVIKRHAKNRQQLVFSSVDAFLQNMPPNSTLECDGTGKLVMKIGGAKLGAGDDNSVISGKIDIGVSLSAEYSRNFKIHKNQNGSFDIEAGNKVAAGAEASIEGSASVGYLDKSKQGTSNSSNVSKQNNKVNVFEIQAGVSANVNAGAALTQKLHLNNQLEATIFMTKMQTGTLTQDDMLNLETGHKFSAELSFDIGASASLSPTEAIINGLIKIPYEDKLENKVNDLSEKAEGKFKGVVQQVSSSLKDVNEQELIGSSASKVVGNVINSAENKLNNIAQNIPEQAKNLEETLIHKAANGMESLAAQGGGKVLNHFISKEGGTALDNEVQEQPKQSDNRTLGNKFKDTVSETVASVGIEQVQSLNENVKEKIAEQSLFKITNATEQDKADFAEKQQEAVSQSQKKSNFEFGLKASVKGGVNVSFESTADSVCSRDITEVSGKLEVEVLGVSPFVLPQSDSAQNANEVEQVETLQGQASKILMFKHRQIIGHNRYCDPSQSNAVTNLAMEVEYTADSKEALMKGLTINHVSRKTAMQIANALSEKDFPVMFSLDMEWNSKDPSTPCGTDALNFSKTHNIDNYRPVNLVLSHSNSVTTEASYAAGAFQFNKTNTMTKNASIRFDDLNREKSVELFIDNFSFPDATGAESEYSSQENRMAQANIMWRK